jgi:hypothetical protein
MCKTGAMPVDESGSKIFFVRSVLEIRVPRESRPTLRLWLRLRDGRARVELHAVHPVVTVRSSAVLVHRFERIINGREYLIEVSPVASDKWRAQIVRRYGGPTALMPFYGATPDEAARQLGAWLCLAHRNGPNSV